MATKKRWSAKVDTESTYPEKGLFKKGARTIARSLASHEVSPKGPASSMRMLNFYINRAGKNLPAARLKVLEHAKEILSGINASQNEATPKKPAQRATKKAAKKAAQKTPAK